MSKRGSKNIKYQEVTLDNYEKATKKCIYENNDFKICNLKGCIFSKDICLECESFKER